MPVKIGDNTYEDHSRAVAAIKKSKPGIKDPDAYVATIERAQKEASLAYTSIRKAMADADTQRKIKGYEDSHPFDSLSETDKLKILRGIKSDAYNPPYADVKYQDLDLTSRQGIDRRFNTEKVAMKLAAFSGSAKADTKKTGADVEKEKEKDDSPVIKFDAFDGGLSAKIRQAIQKHANEGGDFDSDLGNPVKVKKTEAKGDPEHEPLKDGSTPTPKTEPEQEFNYAGAKIARKTINDIRPQPGHPFDSLDPYTKFDIIKQYHGNNFGPSVVNPKFDEQSEPLKEHINKVMGLSHEE